MIKIYLQPKKEDVMVRELNKETSPITFEFSCLPDSFGLRHMGAKSLLQPNEQS